MTSVTWKDLFGFEYGAGMPQPVKLAGKRLGRQAGVIREMQSLLRSAVSMGAPAPTGPAEAWGQGAVTPHNVGAAIDIRYHSKDEHTRAFANGLVELFIQHRVALGWQFMAYNRMQFGPERLTEAKDDAAHLDHIHIDWVDYASSKRSTVLPRFAYIDEQGNAKTKTVGAGGQWVSMAWNGSADAAALPTDFVDDFRQLCTQAATNLRRHAAYTASDFGAAYHGAAGQTSLSWLHGWWSVSDGNPYYYFFGPKGFVQYTKTRPASKAVPLKLPLNQGVYSVTQGNVLFIDWNPADGGATVETFRGASMGSRELRGTSNRYAPLVATRLP